jgi:hypothetical protein
LLSLGARFGEKVALLRPTAKHADWRRWDSRGEHGNYLQADVQQQDLLLWGSLTAAQQQFWAGEETLSTKDIDKATHECTH